MQNITALGFISIIIATLLYGLYGVISKIVGINFGVFFLGWSRGLLVGLIVLAYVILKKQWRPVRRQDYKWFAGMSLFGISAFLSIFVAFNFLPIGTALFTFYASATIASFIIGYFLFQEGFSLNKVLLLLFSLLGLVLLFYSRLYSTAIIFLMVTLFSGGANAVWNVFSKKLSPVYLATQIILIDSVIAIAVSLPLSFIVREGVSPGSFIVELPIIALFAIITVGSNVFTLIGFKNLPAQIASVAMLLEAVFGVLFGWLFFREVLLPLEIIGGIVIIASVAFSNLMSKPGLNIKM